MIFGYNANMSLIERVRQVSNEIKKNYPLIEEGAVAIASTLSPPVDDKPTNSDKFKRYYYLLRYLHPTNAEYSHVFNDMYDIYESGIEDETYKMCMLDIIKYVSHKRETFPLLKDYY